jgi:hypothetical protein
MREEGGGQGRSKEMLCEKKGKVLREAHRQWQ